MTASTRACPACDARIAQLGQLVCGRCWRRVPGPLQKEARKAWRAWHSDWLNGIAMRDYAVCQQAALDSLQAAGA